MPILVATLRSVASDRLKDARALLRAGRFDGAAYLCGYAVEIALKARICQTLRWASFPETGAEFQTYTSLRTHNLDVLLRFSGIEDRIRNNYQVEWSSVKSWTPEDGYKISGRVSPAAAKDIVDAAATLLRTL